MATKNKDADLQQELTTLVETKFPGMTVDVGTSAHWDRPCVTFLWDGFADLLPEERYHRLATVIPERVRTERLKGFVWLELAVNESVDDFLKQPRSEDIAPKQRSIYRKLIDAGFFDALSKKAGPSPDTSCRGDFRVTNATLESKKFSKNAARDAKLVFIRHGVFCDCQVLLTAQTALAEANIGAA